jgi:hypothetical protein
MKEKHPYILSNHCIVQQKLNCNQSSFHTFFETKLNMKLDESQRRPRGLENIKIGGML